MRRSLLRLVIAPCLVLAVAAPASAEPVIKAFHYSDTFTMTRERCGTTWAGELHFDGLAMAKGGRPGEPPRWFDNYSHTVLWVDQNDTSRSYLVETNGVYHDVRVTHEEGTLYRFQAFSAGVYWTVSTADGEVVARDRGSERTEVLVDTKGDSDPSNDEWLVEYGFTDLNGPHRLATSTEAELCAIFAEAADG